MVTSLTNPLGLARITSHWWVPLLRGVVAVIFGVVILLYPISSIFVLVVLFGAFMFVDGILNVVTALRFAHPDTGHWWAILVQGIVGIAIGLITFFLPGLTAITLGFLVGIWAIITGVLEVVAAFRLRRDVSGEIFLFIAGVLSFIVGIWLVAFPVAALVALVYLLAIYAIVGGIALIVLAFRLRAHGALAPT
ncbi:MAG: HdeD family acid-resistance protein [Candidatus Eremiobacteraeota bacterium]|nr:HdeD family acid-resistance protein [Candidatus Eremiobacteraeota bacterium]MBC5804546.1 HdeD family acid-resistance protein [Candidatus Eremiobacteraeota bacterium]MBC5824591.1 HdeD family acid-resistance protein [Candidatus Eremiobacteraeota bacterium]